MKLPRDLDASNFIKKLNELGYHKTRQVGSHIRLTLHLNDKENHITIPNHNPIKIGTLNSILKEIANQLGITKEELTARIF
jgi:predicted RNA binding protein YcfA (HicA-like mRNA interferase family)